MTGSRTGVDWRGSTAGNTDWMSKLPQHAKDKPISELSIPGSHDSFTSSLTPGSVPGPDQPEVIRKLAKDFPCIARNVLCRWSYTQYKDVNFQLDNGIRYFDIRLVAEENEFLIIHCLVGEPVQNILTRLLTFLNEHPGEVVILDFQHLYSFKHSQYLELLNLINDIFGEALCPFTEDYMKVTLNSMLSSGHQVIIVFPILLKYFCWPRLVCPNPWANTTDSTYLTRFLTQGLQERDLSLMFVSQAVFTPSLTTVLFWGWSNLERACARRCNNKVRRWLENTKLKPNILITDFVICSQCSCHIVNKVIGLNFE